MRKTGRYLAEKYWEGILSNCFMDGAIRNTIGNIGSKWRKIGDDGRKTYSPDITRIPS